MILDQPQKTRGMTVIVKTVTRWVTGFILVFGLYQVFYGHHSPGGGFSGGVILASAFILLMLAFGKEICLKLLRLDRTVSLAAAGIMFFLLVGLIAVPLGGYFLANFLFRKKIAVSIDLLGAGTIQPIDIGIALLVTCAIFLIFSYLSFHRVVVREGKRKMESSKPVEED